MSMLTELIYPRRAVCMGCGQARGCDRDDLCERCRTRLARSWIGPRMPGRRTLLDGASYAYDYRGPAGRMVRTLKYRADWQLAESMGADVARAAAQLRLPRVDLVTAVPMHPLRLHRRGQNHAELLARCACARMGETYRDLLFRTRNAPPQALLSAKERRKNLADAFAVLPECQEAVRGATVLLIDDVYTTGSTAKSCAEALRSAGARRVYLAAYARGGGDGFG